MLHANVKNNYKIPLRPAQKIQSYLEQMYEKLGPGESLQIEPIRELAQKLNTSPKTVHKVYRSYVNRGILKSRVGNGTFLVKPEIMPKQSGHFIGITLEAQGIWSSEIYSGILHAAADSKLDVSLKSLSTISEDAIENIVSMAEKLDGLIVFPFPGLQKVIQEYNNKGKLLVYINPPSENATANFVSPDYFGASRLIAEAWRENNRKRVLFISGEIGQSVSTRLRLAGLTCGLGAMLGEGIQIKILESDKEDMSTYRTVLSFVERTSWVPDAIYCAGDFQAIGAYNAMLKLGLSVPRDVSIFGGTGYDLSETNCPTLTRMHQPLHEIGVQCFKLLELRCKLSGEDVPGRYIKTDIKGMGTTDTKENEILEAGMSNNS